MARPKALSQKEQEETLEHFLQNHVVIPEPTIQYVVGQEVLFGAVKKTTITEVLMDGKVYKTHQIITNCNYGNPYDSERDMFCVWHELNPLTNQSEVIETPEYEQISFSQRQLDSLLFLYYRSGVQMDPGYRRDLVWSLEDKRLLLDSIFSHVEIGKFVFARRGFD